MEFFVLAWEFKKQPFGTFMPKRNDIQRFHHWFRPDQTQACELTVPALSLQGAA